MPDALRSSADLRSDSALRSASGLRSASALRSAVGIVLVAVLVCALCVAAGLWQWSRHESRSATAQRVEANYGAPARPLADVLSATGELAPDAEWSTASVTGRYVAREPVTLRNRPVEGRPAVRMLHPVEVTDGEWAGRVLVVDRGWVTTADGGPERRPPAPTGDVELEVRLRPAEPGTAEGAVVAGDARQVRAIVPAAVLEASGAPTAESARAQPLPVYGLLVSEDGGAPTDLAAMPPPDTSLGNNLSYAFQWWVFALGALGGAVVLIRRERGENAADDDVPAHASGATGGAPPTTSPQRPAADAARATPRRRRRPTAEEEEDALLDAQLGPRDEVSRGPA